MAEYDKKDIRSVEGVIELIRLLITKPAIFGINRIEDVDLVIKGYFHKSYNKEIEAFFILFNDFVNRIYFKDRKKDFEWVKIIRFNTSSDSHSIKLFSSLFEKFLETRDSIQNG